jgi:dihydrofolate reductase
MGRVIAEISMSLDGFTAGSNVAVGNGMGDNGERLHGWMAQQGAEPDYRNDLLRSGHTGAVVVGRRMFDVGVEPWGDDPPFHMPVFVVTHRAHDPLVKLGGTTYHFVTGGIEEALAQAKATAGTKDIGIFGGADVIRQCIKGGFLDELQLHLAHVLLGDGTRFFGDLDAASAAFERTRVVDGEGVTHLRFRLVK